MAEAAAAGQKLQTLAVYVVWHPDFPAGAEYAAYLYDHLTRNTQVPLSRGMGIPVFLRTAKADGGVPEVIPFQEASKTVVVLLVDDKMVLARSKGWGQYVKDLLAAKGTDGRILPVKLSANAFTLDPQLRSVNFLSLDAVPAEARPQRLLIGLVHDLCRLLSGEPPTSYSLISGDRKTESVANPVQIFISHAKKDGEPLALRIRDYITTNLQLDTFFDKNQIYYAEDFASVLEQNVEKSALLVLQTDAYSSREWCQREVLVAKRHGRPVLVLHKVDVHEQRSFPYLGNLPVIRYSDALPIDGIIARLLLEVLRTEYFPRQFGRLADLFGRPRENLAPLSRSPELLDVAPRNNGRTVVYPDPPLGCHEVDLLREFNSTCELTTPLFLLSGTPGLQGVLVGLSLSGIAPEPRLEVELRKLGLLRAHFDDAVSDFALFLLASGANLAYGGDLRPGGFTEKLHDLVRSYSDPRKSAGDPPTIRIQNFLAWVAHLGQDERRLQFMECMDPVTLDLPADVAAELKIDPLTTVAAPFPPNTPEADYLAARCFTEMREEMNRRISARVLLGGPLAGFAGRFPGLLEEALLAVRDNLPMYPIGAFGGCTRAIIDALEGQQPKSLTLAGQLELDDDFQKKNPASGKTPYAKRMEDFNRRATASAGVEPIDVDAALNRLSSCGTEGLSRNNGLTVEENRRLFTTPHNSEMIYLVLKGLRTLKEAGRLRQSDLQ